MTFKALVVEKTDEGTQAGVRALICMIPVPRVRRRVRNTAVGKFRSNIQNLHFELVRLSTS